MEQLVVGYLLPIVGSFLAVMLSILATCATKWLMRKLGREMTKEQEAEIDKAVEDAVWAAEERMARELKAGNVVKEMTGKIKYNFVLDIIGNRFPTLTQEEARIKVNAMLGKTPGLGASADQEKCEEPIPDERNWKIVPDDCPVITP